MNKKVLLIGFGMQGKAVLQDLVRSDLASTIVVADSRPDLLSHLGGYAPDQVRGRILDASDESALAHLMRDADIVIEALPGNFALPIGRLAAECGVNLVSSMYYLNPGELDPGKIQAMQNEIARIDRKAKEKGIVILTEFGLDPGLDLIIGVDAIRQLDEVHGFNMYGTGIPAPNARANPLKYKFSWSIAGVMKAYQRVARIISNGEIRTIPPDCLFEPRYCHNIEVEAVGSPLECFPNGDGVHYAELFGIAKTVREMGRYTCRLPGHCAFWDPLVKCGFLGQEAIDVGASPVVPMQFTAALLGSQKQFHYAEGEQDMILVRVDAQGIRAGKKRRLIYDLIDFRDLETGLTSMQRTVGFTLSLGARLILERKIHRAGVLTPLDVPYEEVFPALERHNIRVTRRMEESPR
jgi:lysine 6-dehydrogenase